MRASINTRHVGSSQSESPWFLLALGIEVDQLDKLGKHALSLVCGSLDVRVWISGVRARIRIPRVPSDLGGLVVFIIAT